MYPLIYFSSQSENTHRFVQRLEMPAWRIPLDTKQTLAVDTPFILLVPSYGGGNARGAVPRQVIHFLNQPTHRLLIRGVIAAGNRNFGEAYGLAGDIIARKCQVRCLYKFELLGTEQDIMRVRQGVIQFWQQQSAH